MIIAFIIFAILVAFVLLPSQLGAQKAELYDVQTSLTMRLEQLKKDFQFRTRELAKRLENGDLAQDEWQKLTDELQTDTRASIDSTQITSSTQKNNVSLFSSLSILLAVIVLSYTSYHYAGFYQQAIHQQEISDLLQTDPQTIDKFTQEAQVSKSQQALNNLYLALRTRVELLPANVSSWREIATFNANYGRVTEARSAIKIAMAIEPDNLDLKIDMAQILSQSKEKEDIFLSLKLTDEVLKQQPLHEGALFLFARSTFDFGLYDKSLVTFKKLINLYEPGSDIASVLQKRINQVEQMINGQPETSPATANATQTSIKVTVVIPDSVRARLKGDENVFVFAKSVGSGNIPLAVIKTKLSALREAIILSDKNAMRPDLVLSKFGQIKVTARISIAGDVIAKPGDIQGHSDILSSPFDGAEIKIIVDEVIE